MATKKTPAKTVAAKPKRPVGRPRKAVAKAPARLTPVTRTPAVEKAVEAPKAVAPAPQAAPQAAVVGGFASFTSLGKDNLSAVIESGNILAKGIEGLNQEILAFAGAAVHHNIETASALFGAKTFSDVVGVQRNYAQESLDRTLSESAKLTQIGAQVARDAFAPLQSRVAVAIETAARGKAA
ncbi:MAG: phasin family protein [Pseudomonadota bacterium]